LKQDRKESTKYQYLVSVKNYCDFRGKTPKKLLHDVFMENRRIKDNIKKSKDNIKRFERTLLEEGMSDATVKTYMAGINSFFKYGLSEIKKYFIEVLEENGIQYEKNSQFEALKELGYKGTARGPGRFALIKNDGSLEEIIRHSNDYRNIFVKEENGLFKELKHRGKTYKKVLRVLRGLDNTHEIRMSIIKKQSIEDKFLEYYSS
jgi:integrase